MRSTLRWSSGSKVRSDSTMPSKISMRSGSSLAKGNTSRISPRHEASPGFSASGVRVKPASTSLVSSASRSSCTPVCRCSHLVSTSSGAGSGSSTESNEATTTRGLRSSGADSCCAACKRLRTPSASDSPRAGNSSASTPKAARSSCTPAASASVEATTHQPAFVRRIKRAKIKACDAPHRLPADALPRASSLSKASTCASGGRRSGSINRLPVCLTVLTRWPYCASLLRRARRASWAAHVSASRKLRPHAAVCWTPSTSAHTQKTFSCAAPRLSSST